MHVTLVIQQALYYYKNLRKTTRQHCQPKIAEKDSFMLMLLIAWAAL